ncbi:MAG: DUF309 domain-containing protein [Desulfobacterales bacterium]|nr:DUF309 domain-containing protein [Desulfobacterales bacterium]
MLIDPFSDRMARDIRNSLSSALVRELTASDGEGIAAVADQWLAKPVTEVYRSYVEEHSRVYRQVLQDIRSKGLRSTRLQAVALWNAGLYFELHELLETIWIDAPEPERTALKGWIQAAGAYLHFERGKPDAARGLAQRARRHLAAGAAALAFIVNLDQLIETLDLPIPPSLRLGIDETRLPPR